MVPIITINFTARQKHTQCEIPAQLQNTLLTQPRWIKAPGQMSLVWNNARWSVSLWLRWPRALIDIASYHESRDICLYTWAV